MITRTTTHIQRKSFPVTGMTCAGCAVSVESMLTSTPGVTDAGVNFANNTAWASYDETQTNPGQLQKAIQAIGYDLIIDAEDPAKVQEEVQQKNYQSIKQRTIWSSVLALPVFLISMFFMDIVYANWLSMLLTIPVVGWFGRNFFIGAWKQARHGKANMDTLVALSTGIALVFSAFNTVDPEFWHRRGVHPHVYFEAAAVIIAFISLGKLLEEKAKSNTTSAIKKLMGLQPKTLRVISNGIEREVSIASVLPGDCIIVRPGEQVAVDGTVSEANSYVDESMITGEPVPVEKWIDSKVFAGTINQKGSFRVIADKVGSDTFLAHIVKMVQEAQGSKAPLQKLVDRIAGIFVPVVIGISILTFIIWMLTGSADAFTHALLASVTVLVIACPCALGLATPTAIMVGVGKGAENHILIKDAEALELAYKVNAIVVDKTGTITVGKPKITGIHWINPIENVTLLKQVLYSMELRSEHPLAQAVVDEIAKSTTTILSLQKFESLTGRGIKSMYNDSVYYIGNRQLMEEKQIFIDASLLVKAKEWQGSSQTVIYFGNSRQTLAVIGIADEVKSSSAQAIKQLIQSGIDVFMLTGDNQQTAAAIANEVGIKNFKAEVLPHDKAEFVKALQAKGKVVAMVGDGINDSEALAQADVSIAMGKGSDIAMDVAGL